MKNIFLITILSLLSFPAFPQKKPIVEIDKMITRPDVEAPLTFLAADDMRGRDTGSHELDIAANYISAYFQQLDLHLLPGADMYFQHVELENTYLPTSAELTLGSDKFLLNEQLLVRDGINGDWQGEFVFVGYGSAQELPSTISGKVVVALAGTKDMTNPMEIFTASREKLAQIKKLGGAGMIEILTTLPYPWPTLVEIYKRSRTRLKAEGAVIPSIFLLDSPGAGLKELKEKGIISGSIKIGGARRTSISVKNVLGQIKGTDAVLKNEYIVISAHYDHVGIGPKKDMDSIYNGARDNALGTVGMMTAARFFSKFPPKRSIIFMALTGEERGLLGSAWYADHPLVPLRQTVFDFDCDGAGYNDKTVATVIGLERTTAEANISKACEAFGLKAGRDPVPEQNLYERSDNYNFARKGIPAIDFSTGVKSFDEEIMKYYHQPADEVGSLDFEYLLKYYKAFVYANYLIANDLKTPVWTAGDKFESVGKALYEKPKN